MPPTLHDSHDARERPNAALAPRLTRTRVLLIDPDRDSRERTCALLDGANLLVAACASCADAPRVIRDALHEAPPDVILVDAAQFGTSELDGWERHLPSMPTHEETAVMLLTDAGVDADRLIDLEARADGCLVRPLRLEELQLRLRSVLRVRRQRLARLGLRELRAEQARMWSVLLDFSRSMARATDLETVLEAIVMTAAEMTCSRRVSLMLPDRQQKFLTIRKAIGLDENMQREVRLPVGEAIAGRAFASGRRMLSTEDAALPPGGGLAYNGETFVSMPIFASTTTIRQQSLGVLNITNRYGDRPFQEWELEFIDMLGGIAGSVVDDTLWRQARESILRFERDLLVARRIQLKTLPSTLPSLDGFEIDAWSEPADETAGDSYDVIGFRREGEDVHLCTDGPERVFLMLADATGHGIGPALSVTQARAMLRMAVRMQPELGRCVLRMNEQLCADLPRGRFITAWFGELDVAARTLTAVSAGQGPILVYRAATDEFEELAADVPPLGIVPGLAPPPLRSIPLKPGDVVAVLSDGIFDAQDRDGGIFGVDRATAIIRGSRLESAEDILAALREAVGTFTTGVRADDDRTALVLKRRGGA